MIEGVTYSTESASHPANQLRKVAAEALRRSGGYVTPATMLLCKELNHAPALKTALVELYWERLVSLLVIDTARNGIKKIGATSTVLGKAILRPPQREAVATKITPNGQCPLAAAASQTTHQGASVLPAAPYKPSNGVPVVARLRAPPGQGPSMAQRSAHVANMIAIAKNSLMNFETPLGRLGDRTKNELLALTARTKRDARFYSILGDQMPPLGTVEEILDDKTLGEAMTCAEAPQND